MRKNKNKPETVDTASVTETEEIKVPKKKKKKTGLIVFLIILILAVAGAAAYYFMERQKPISTTKNYLENVQAMNFDGMKELLQSNDMSALDNADITSTAYTNFFKTINQKMSFEIKKTRFNIQNGTATVTAHIKYIDGSDIYKETITEFLKQIVSTAFAGVKSIFQAIAAGQPVTWNSFLDVTGALLLLTVLFGRHFCGYACAFGSLGDAMYELTVFIRQKVFHKKGRHGYPEKVVRYLQKVKYLLLAFLLLSILAGWYSNLQGMSPWDVFSMLTAQKLPNASYKIGIILLVLILIGMCTQERFFCQFLCPMGAVFAMMPILPSALFKRDRSKCPAKCGLCRKRCPAHLDIDGDTLLSGECICCHACEATCPRKNIQIGQEVEQKEAEAVSSIRGEGK